MIVGLGHVDLVCRDVERSVAFYRAVLDLGEPAIFEGEPLATGATVLHAPRLWPEYAEDYYATFFLDPEWSGALVSPWVGSV